MNPASPTNTHTNTHTSFESRLRQLIKTHPFLRYASLHWHEHLAAAGAAWPSKHDGDEALQRMRRRWLEDETSAYGRCWSEVWWFFVRGVAQPYPEEGGGLPGRIMKRAVVKEAVVKGPVGVVVGFVEGGGGGKGGDGEIVEVGDRAGVDVGIESDSVVVERGRGDAGEERGGEDDASSFHSCGGQHETLDQNAPDGLGISLPGTVKGKAQKEERTMAKNERVEGKVVFVENAPVDPPGPKAEMVEKATEPVIKVEMVERIKTVEVDKTPPRKEKEKLGKWNRVKKIGMKLVYEVFTT